MARKLVVIGNGMAPGRALERLFERAPGAFDVTIFNAEPRVNYNRLMLSPVLAGEKRYADILTHDDAWYARHGVTLHKGCRVTGIDRAARTVSSANGLAASYDHLIVATGSTPFVPPIPGADLPGVLAYRDLDDVEKMLAAAERGGRAVVIGGGLLGLEAAAGLKARGMDVTVLHLMPTLMERQLDPAAGLLLQRALERRGIAVVTAANTRRILGEDAVSGIEMADGTAIEAQLVVMAVGIRPATALAAGAGLAVNRGIVVDDCLRTSDPAISALGECVEHRGQVYGLVAPLYEMAEVLADRLAGRTGALFSGARTATRLKVSGIDLFSAGDFAAAPDREEIVFSDPESGIYKRLVLQDGSLVGAVLFGETADGPWFFDLVCANRPVAAFRDTLLFGSAFESEAAALAEAA